MAAISMRAGGDAGEFVRSFTGNNRFILDYLTEEVLQRQPEEVQNFLLKTSILERLCGPLCDCVMEAGEKGDAISTGMPGTRRVHAHEATPGSPSLSSEVLEYLERSNLFLIPLDDQRIWYRFHRLFSDLLQARLARTRPEHIPHLHRQASLWFEANGYLSEAIGHALTGQDFERAAALIARVAEATLKRSEVMTLSRWIDQLPEKQVRAIPDLVTYYAWTLMLGGRPYEEVQACLDLYPAESGSISARSLPLYAFLALYQGDLQRAVQLSRQAIELLDTSDSYLLHAATFVQSLSLLAEGDPAAGSLAMEEIARSSQETGNSLVAVLALASLAENYKKTGQLRQAYQIYQQAMRMAVDEQGNRLPIAGRALIGASDIRPRMEPAG